MLNLIGRSRNLFQEDLENERKILSQIRSSSFLVIGGAGSIGSAVVKEIFKRHPHKLHVVDISENNLVELVRDIRSSFAYISGDFKTFAVDFGDDSFVKMVADEGPYDFVLNLAALKHVRSERDPYTLLRMIQVNIVNTIKSVDIAERFGAKKYFAVSSDKAANPANLMGATKRIMELFLFNNRTIDVSMARFANVAFSDGSLLSGFQNRMLKNQPLVAPVDIERYFITPEESGILCLMSCLCGSDNEIFFPQDFSELKLTKFSDIAIRYLEAQNLEPIICETEEEARQIANRSVIKKKWPIYLFKSDTTGEKPFEEFYTSNEEVDTARYKDIGVIKNMPILNQASLEKFIEQYQNIRDKKTQNKSDYVQIIEEILSDFKHNEVYKNLDQKM